jgi:hypothetical protein
MSCRVRFPSVELTRRWEAGSVLGPVVEVVETRKNRYLSLLCCSQRHCFLSHFEERSVLEGEVERKCLCEVLGVREVCLVLGTFAWC